MAEGTCLNLDVWYLGLRDELGDLLARVKRSYFNVGHPPVGSPRRLQDLIVFLQDLPEARKVQVL